MGCDQSQGFLHSRAVTAAEFAQLLQFGRGLLMQPAEHVEEHEGELLLRAAGGAQ
jgi:hypothetical protein